MTTPLWKRIIARILEALLAIIFISPLVWVIICSFSPQAGSAQSKGWGVANYLTLFGYQEGLPKYLFNSVIVTLVAVVFSVVVCTLAGYSFSRFDYPGRNLGFMVTLSILMVPYASLLIPLMVWYKQIGLNDSLLGVGLVITLFQLPMSTFIMRNAFDAIPKDMEEAAMVDGCNSLQALFKILVPVVKPSRRPPSLTRRRCIRLAPIVQYSPLLPPVGVWAVSQSQCGRSPSQAGYPSKPRWAVTPPSS